MSRVFKIQCVLATATFLRKLLLGVHCKHPSNSNTPLLLYFSLSWDVSSALVNRSCSIAAKEKAVADRWIEWDSEGCWEGGGEAPTRLAGREDRAAVVESVLVRKAPNIISGRNYRIFCNIVIYSLLFIALQVGVAQILSHPGLNMRKSKMT